MYQHNFALEIILILYIKQFSYKQTLEMNRIFGILFLLTGIFAVVGGLYTWGDGSIFIQQELSKVLIPWADIILTGPISVICGYGILKNRNWGQILGIGISGIYVFGSILVFISIYWNKDFSACLIVPACSGFLIGLSFTVSKLSFVKSK